MSTYVLVCLYLLPTFLTYVRLPATVTSEFPPTWDEIKVSSLFLIKSVNLLYFFVCYSLSEGEKCIIIIMVNCICGCRLYNEDMRCKIKPGFKMYSVSRISHSGIILLLLRFHPRATVESNVEGKYPTVTHHSLQSNKAFALVWNSIRLF